MSTETTPPSLQSAAHGAWNLVAHGRSPSVLLHAFDPQGGNIVIEGHVVTGHEWQQLPVVLHDDGAACEHRMVRAFLVDVLLSPTEALAEAQDCDLGSAHAGLLAWQAPSIPRHLRMLDKERPDSLDAARRDVGVTLYIDCPHRCETAVLWSPDRATLEAAEGRMQAALNA